MEIYTTKEEDVKAKTLLKEALEQAYLKGKLDAGGATPELERDEFPDVDQLWEKLMRIIGVEV